VTLSDGGRVVLVEAVPMLKHSRSTFLGLAGAALAAPSLARAADAVSIKMAGVPEDSATTVLYAIQSGLFTSAGLDVDMEPQRSGPSVMSGVVGSSYQFGKSSTPPLMAAISRGLPFLIVAPAGIYDGREPIAALLVKKDGPYKKASDLNGKTIAVGALNDIHSLATKAWIDQNGGDSTTVKFVEIPIAETPVAIEQSRVDAGSVNEPVLSAALSDNAVRVLGRNFDGIAPRFLYTAWFTSKPYAAANAAVVRNVAGVLKKSAGYVNTHHAQTIDLIAKFTSLEPSQVQKMTRVEQGTTLDPKLLQPVIDTMLKYKLIPQTIDAHELMVTNT
jgi:NitT/TauT family transport system substrate-binding protein